MKDTADDLLQELESLDDSEGTDSPADAPSSPPPSTASPLETLLEATRLAQEAGEEAQIAAERSLALAKEEKESIIEISDALGAWRHASRSAIDDMRAARRHMAIMMGVSLLFGAAAMGVTGWMMYQIKYEAESAKADILDLMQTQFTLFNQKTGLKVDELASLIESMQAEVQRMLKESGGVQHHVTPVDIVAPGADTAQPSAHAVKHAADTPHGAQAAHAPHRPATHAPAPPARSAAPETHAAPPAHAADHAANRAAHQVPQAPAHAAQEPAASGIDTHAILARLNALEKQLSTLLKQQQTVHVAAPVHTAAVSPKEIKELRQLLMKQDKQLRIIRAALWKLRQQQAQGGGAPSADKKADLQEIKQAIETLTEQVNQLRDQQEALQETVEKLKQETSKLNQPYRYKAPPLHLD